MRSISLASAPLAKRRIILAFPAEAMERLGVKEYPGNARELSNIVRNAVIQADSQFVSIKP